MHMKITKKIARFTDITDISNTWKLTMRLIKLKWITKCKWSEINK